MHECIGRKLSHLRDADAVAFYRRLERRSAVTPADVLVALLLRTCSPATLETIVARVERSFSDWHQPPGGSIHERVSQLLEEER
jgi:hypothetical protein